MAPSLFNRDFLLNVGGLEIRSRSPDGRTRPTLRVTFRIERSLSKSLNTADLAIYNLKPDSRTFLQIIDQDASLPTFIQAGYIDSVSELFSGNLRFGGSVRVGTDWITTVQSQDGAAVAANRISLSFKKIKLGEVLRRLATELGAGLGNISKKALEGAKRGETTEFLKGVVLQGNTYDELDRIAQKMGFQISIQSDQSIALEPTETLGPLVQLAEGKGLIGSPEPGEKGIVSARSLIQPNLLPGHPLALAAESIEGFFRIERVVFTGDTWGDDWYADLELKPT